VLLARALERTGRVAIGRVVMRARGQLVAVLPADGMLRLHTMRFAGELASPPSVDAKASGKQPDPRSLKMAASLVDSLSACFEPDKYEDTYRERVPQNGGGAAKKKRPAPAKNQRTRSTAKAKG